MNIKSLSTALLLAAGSVLTVANAQAAAITTLPTLQVRPSVDQLAQRDHELASGIPTLASVEVRPSPEQIAEYEAEQMAQAHVTTLAAVQVRPSDEQRAQLLASRSVAVAGAGAAFSAEASAAVSSLIDQVIVHLPMSSLRPTEADLDALLGNIGQFNARF